MIFIERILCVISLSLIIVLQSGCAKSSHASFCDIYNPVYMSVDDSEETKNQIDANNAVWLDLCL